MDELATFFQLLGFLILAGVFGVVLIVSLACTVVLFGAWVVLEGGRLFWAWASARLRR